MAKILVLYHSNSGNTKQMAQHVADGARQLSGTDVRLRDISEADHTDLTWCDGMALGSPTNYGTVSWQMKKWWMNSRLRTGGIATDASAVYFLLRSMGRRSGMDMHGSDVNPDQLRFFLSSA